MKNKKKTGKGAILPVLDFKRRRPDASRSTYPTLKTENPLNQEAAIPTESAY
jgi:hypothetical protein